MPPSLSWIEPDELQQALSRSARRRSSAPPESGPPTEKWEVVQTRDMPRPAEHPLPEIAPGASISERARVIGEWLASSSGSESVCIADSEGLPVYGRSAGEAQAVYSAALAAALRTLGPMVGDARAVSLELADGRTSQVIWAQTSYGSAACVLAPEAPIERNRSQKIREALRRLFEG